VRQLGEYGGKLAQGLDRYLWNRNELAGGAPFRITHPRRDRAERPVRQHAEVNSFAVGKPM
jgi:hypothetical protein